MTTRAMSLVAGLLLLLGSVGLPDPLLADRYPCCNLILPYFEVQLSEEGTNPFDKETTLFSVGNCGDEPMHLQLTVWTNWAQPVIVTHVAVGAKSVKPFNLRDWVLFGRLPDRQLGAEELAHVQAALCGEPSPVNGLYYGRHVADKLAVGFVSVESDRALFGDATDLWGDFFAVDPSRDFAAGESLVRMVGDASREVCERHLLRFLETGEVEQAGGLATQLVFWTGIGGPPSPTPRERFAPMNATCTVYDQQGLELGVWELPLLATQAIPVKDLGWPARFGWVDCVTPASTFTCMHFHAEGRYTMTLRSFCGETELVPPEPREPAGLRLEKHTEGFDADLPTGPELVVGDPVEWTFEITNTGTVPLHAIELEDDQLGDVHCPEDELAAGASMTCTATGVVEEGQYRNIGTVDARTPRGRRVEASDPSHYVGLPDVPPPEAAVELEKSTLGVDADDPPGPEVPVGGPVLWTYLVTNTGETVLIDIVVSDDRGVAVTCPRMDLGPGESFLCTASGVATAGQYANVGTVTAQTDSGQEVTDSDPSHYFGEEEPPPGDEGCTPGYWKNHTESWPPTGSSPSQTVVSVFAQGGAYPALGAATLIEVLDFGGGPGVEGAASILLRAGVAALLNAASPNVNYPRTVAEVIAQVDAALAGGDRDAMLLLAAALDADNNLGCPLS